MFFTLISVRRTLYSTRNPQKIHLPNTNHRFFPYIITELNSLDRGTKKSESFLVSKTNILKFMQPSRSSVYNYHKPKQICFIKRLRLGLSYFREGKFK